jgi:purine-cytosine permease-like protein
VSSQNLRDRINQRGAVLAVAAAGVALAAWLGRRPAAGIGSYESFLFLLGSVFVPLFGVFVADYFLLGRRGHREADLFGGGEGVGAPMVRGRAFVAWVLGFLVYQWSVPTGPGGWRSAVETVLHGWLHLPFPLAGSGAGASLPAFGVALLAHLALGCGSNLRRGRVRAMSGRPR